MDLKLVKNNLPITPAFVIDENKIIENLTELVEIKAQTDCQILYSIKALPHQLVLETVKEYLDGFSVSSLFEARLAKEILGDNGSIHITTPGLRKDEFLEITNLCTHVSFNSINQFQRLQSISTEQISYGLRLNPKLSFADDLRYDPCRPNSKLGVEIESIGSSMDSIDGLHFHNVFSQTDYHALIKTVALLKDKLGHQLTQLKWINLGGGYLFNQIQNHQPLIDQLRLLKAEYELEVYLEPGKAVVGNAGYLVTTVIDGFISDGKEIIVLDTSVNHNPEVFEYQKKPHLLEEIYTDLKFNCVLAGSSCLAGDIFGVYHFAKMPRVGDRLVFSDVGAYSQIKANRFNGYNLPAVYSVDRNKQFVFIQQSSYSHFRQQWVR